MDEIKLIEEGDTCGVKVATDRHMWEVVLNSTGALGGHIRRTGNGRKIDKDLNSNIQKQAGIISKM